MTTYGAYQDALLQHNSNIANPNVIHNHLAGRTNIADHTTEKPILADSTGHLKVQLHDEHSGHINNTAGIGDGTTVLRTVDLGYDRVNGQGRSKLVDSAGRQVVNLTGNTSTDGTGTNYHLKADSGGHLKVDLHENMSGAINNTTGIGDGTTVLRTVPLGYDRSNGQGRSLLVDSDGHLQVDIVSGGGSGGGDASAANQTTMITSLATLETTLTNIETDAAALEVLQTTTNTKLGTLETDVEATNTALATIDGVLDNILVDTSAIKVDAAALEVLQTSTNTKLDTLETTLTAIESDSAAIKTAVELLDNAVSGSELQVDVVSSALPSGAASETTLAAAEVHLGNVETKLGTLETDVEATNTALATIDGVLDNILVDTSAIKVDAAALEVLQTTTNTKLDTVETTLTAIETDAAALEVLQTSTNSKLDHLSDNLDTIETTLTAIETDAAALETLQTSTNTKLDTLETTLTAIETDAAALEVLQTTTNSKLDTLETTLTAIETDAAAIETLITSTNSKIDTLDSVQDNALTKLTEIDTAIDSIDGKLNQGYDSQVSSGGSGLQQVLAYGRDSGGNLDALNVDNAGHLKVISAVVENKGSEGNILSSASLNNSTATSSLNVSDYNQVNFMHEDNNTGNSNGIRVEVSENNSKFYVHSEYFPTVYGSVRQYVSNPSIQLNGIKYIRFNNHNTGASNDLTSVHITVVGTPN